MTRRCLAWWCARESAPDRVLCEIHSEMLSPAMRQNLDAAVHGAIGWIAAAQMQELFKSLPEQTREELRERARQS